MANLATSSNANSENGSLVGTQFRFKRWRVNAFLAPLAIAASAWLVLILPTPAKYADRTLSPTYYYFAAAVTIAALVLSFLLTRFAPWIYRAACPNCHRYINILDPWVCPYCSHTNTNTRRYNIFTRCGSCKRAPTAYYCEHCTSVLNIVTEPDRLMIAKRFVPDRPEPVEVEEHRKEIGRIQRVRERLSMEEQLEADQLVQLTRKLALKKSLRSEAGLGYQDMLHRDWENRQARLEHLVAKREQLWRFRNEKVAHIEKLVNERIISKDEFEFFRANLEDFIEKQSEL
jgi:hypothetical protein